MLGAALETTQADVNAATQAQESGEERSVGLGRTVVLLFPSRLCDRPGVREPVAWGLPVPA